MGPRFHPRDIEVEFVGDTEVFILRTISKEVPVHAGGNVVVVQVVALTVDASNLGRGLTGARLLCPRSRALSRGRPVHPRFVLVQPVGDGSITFPFILSVDEIPHKKKHRQHVASFCFVAILSTRFTWPVVFLVGLAASERAEVRRTSTSIVPYRATLHVVKSRAA